MQIDGIHYSWWMVIFGVIWGTVSAPFDAVGNHLKRRAK